MGKCSQCPKSHSRLYPDGLCNECQERKLVNCDNGETLLGLTDEQLNDLSELPTNWVNEPFHTLTGGHLLNLIMLANNVLLTKIKEVNLTINNIKI